MAWNFSYSGSTKPEFSVNSNHVLVGSATYPKTVENSPNFVVVGQTASEKSSIGNAKVSVSKIPNYELDINATTLLITAN